MFDLYGCYFMYGDFNSEDYDLVFGNMDTSRLMALEASKNINTVRSRKHNVHYVNRVSYVDEPISFEAEIFTRDTTPIMLEDLPVIEHALFNRQSYTKLYQIMSHERDPVYINCILTNPEKIENLSGIVGYKFVVNMDSVMAWEEASTHETSVESTTTTLTGNPVNFTEDKEYPFNQLLVNIDAEQDLHGQANPYPAGGGKNLLPPAPVYTETKNGVTLTSNGDGTYSLTGTATGGSASFNVQLSQDSPVVHTGQYIHIRNSKANGSITITLRDIDATQTGNGTPYLGISPVNRIYQMSSAFDNKQIKSLNFYVANGVNTEGVTFAFSVEDSESETNFSPYENICPITGVNGANITRTGKNLLLVSEATLAKPSYYSSTWTGTTVADGENAITVTRGTGSGGFGGVVLNGIFEGAYRFSCSVEASESANAFYYGYYANGVYSGQQNVGSFSNTNTHPSFTITLPSGTTSLFIKMSTNNSYVPRTYSKLQLEKGSATTEFEPYTANTYTTAVNIWDEEWVNGYFGANGSWNTSTDTIASKNPISVQPNTTYYFNVGSNQNCYVTYWTEAVPSGTTDSTHIISRSSALQNATFTTPANCYAIHFNAGTAYGGTYKNNISINTPSSVKAYLQYKGQATTENYINAFGNGLYGGTLNIETGVLTVTHSIVDLGTLTWIAGASDTSGIYTMRSSDIVNIIEKPSSSSIVADIICSAYKTENGDDAYLKKIGISILSTGAISVYDERYNTGDSPSAFTTAMDGVQLVYKLVNPVTYNLTSYEIKTLIGQNNIWTDVGEVTVSYSQTNDFHVDVDTDLNDYIYPDVAIEVGSEGGDIIIYNATDDATRFTEFSSVPPSTTFTMKGSINHITNNMYPYFTSRNFIRLVNGRNNFFMYGDISKITFSFNNRKYM